MKDSLKISRATSPTDMSTPSKFNLTISVVIPVHNDPKNIRLCLGALGNSNYLRYEIIVVDDASVDNTYFEVQNFPAKIVRLSKKRGPAYARNRGAELASGEVIFFVDADVLVYPDTLSKIADTFKNSIGVDAIMGSYDDCPHDKSFISQYKNLFHHYVHQVSNKNACTFWSGCGAIRRSVFLQLGGFSESYARPSIEDIELGYRLKANHRNILLMKDLQVKHLKRWTFWGLIKTDVIDRGIPWTKLMLRDKVIPNDLNARFSQRICVILSYLFIFLLGFFAIFSRQFLFIPFLLLATIIIINNQLYRFFAQKRNLIFAAKVVPFHVLYYFYSGLSFLFGVFAYSLSKRSIR
ncbi:MAG: glycosyltransferase family 2 protein [Bacteroidetes bacterium]|nr:glycosyltransferase family 2 protein [Bacteroidota bacterium]